MNLEIDSESGQNKPRHFDIKYGEKKSCHFQPYFAKKMMDLPIYLAGFGIRYPQEPRDLGRESWLEYPALLFCTEGKGECWLDDEYYEMTPGMGIIQTPGMHMKYHATAEVFTTYFIQVDGGLKNNIFKYPNMFFHLSDVKYYLDMFYKIATLPFDNEWLYESSALLYKMILHLNDDMASEVHFDTKYENILKPVIMYCSYNISSPYNLSDLADVLGVTPTHICRLFKLAYNMTPGQYVQKLKMDYAKMLLENHPEWNVRIIAEKCGYYDLAYFSAVFKKEAGISPGNYRKKKITR